MTEPTIICPNCRTEIKLTESLAAPFIESIRRDYEQRLTQKDVDIAKRETSWMGALLQLQKLTFHLSQVSKDRRKRPSRPFSLEPLRVPTLFLS